MTTKITFEPDPEAELELEYQAEFEALDLDQLRFRIAVLMGSQYMELEPYVNAALDVYEQKIMQYYANVNGGGYAD